MKWRWVGHTLRRPVSIARQSLTWNPQGKRKKGRPRNTWRRDLEKETAKIKKLKGDIAMMNIKTNGQLRDVDFKDVQISKLENQVKEMEEELNSM